MEGFEEYTVEDTTALLVMLASFLTRDWELEYLRDRLTQIYDRDLVDQLFPFKKEHYFDLGKMETISDDELIEHGFHHENNAENLFAFDESLFHFRSKTKEKLEIKADFPKKSIFRPDVLSGWEMIGSNCFAVHGNFTKFGKPILSCDPHLAKFTNPTWYLTRL
jgi:acyl-homoserine lactone acylase PvdQ